LCANNVNIEKQAYYLKRKSALLCKKKVLLAFEQNNHQKPKSTGKKNLKPYIKNLTLYITDHVKNVLLKTKTLLFDLRCKLFCTIKTILVAKHILKQGKSVLIFVLIDLLFKKVISDISLT